MQQVDLALFNVRVFNVSVFDIIPGQAFTLYTNMGPNIRWFSDNDQILDITAKGDIADVVVGSIEGEATILIMSQDKAILKELVVRVYNTIPLPATTLDATTAPPVSK